MSRLKPDPVWATVAVLLLAALPVAGQDAAQTTTPETPEDNRPVEITAPYNYRSSEGEFAVMWPSGCGKLKRGSTEPDADADPFEVVFLHSVSCEQSGENGRGCSVTAVFNRKGADGGIPGPPEVLADVTARLQSFGVEVVQQRPLKRELPDGSFIEGVEVLAADPEGIGQVWMRGLIHVGDIFILAAWDLGGELWEDPEYQVFFNSFEPAVE